MKLDFIWSTKKGYASLKPLYDFMVKKGWETCIYHIHKLPIRNFRTIRKLSNIVVIAFDEPLKRIKRSGWDGKYIYIEHGLGAMKYYTYKYNFFHDADLLFYPGEVFKRKMEAINPKFNNGLLGGDPKIDELISMKINKESLVKRYQLSNELPIILFAPTWGGKKNKNWGIRNGRFLKDVPNVVMVPHSSDYPLAKKYGAVIPNQKSNINELLHLADIVISDVSSVLAEAALIGKPVIQLEIDSYPGCFPSEDRRKNDSWIDETTLKNEEIQASNNFRPFKIAYLDEDWILGRTVKPDSIKEAINETIENPKKYSEKANYWAEQSCWKADGKTCERMEKMISHFIQSGEVKQYN